MTQILRNTFSRRAVLASVGALAAAPVAASGLLHAVSDESAVVDAAIRRERLKAVRNWGYQLHSLELDALTRSAHDLLVVDVAREADGRKGKPFTRNEIKRVQVKPDGSRRLVLAYLSIGEAESYRTYWQRHWDDARQAPTWLGSMNPRWEGNYPVRFWHPEWQELIIDAESGYLAAIRRQGFDGIYLDRADVFQEWLSERPTAGDDMEAFLERIADVARQEQPGFLVVMQNAEELLGRPAVLNAIDAIAKEDLYFGLDFSGGENSAQEVADSIGYLRLAQKADRPVLVVEYVSEPGKIRALSMHAKREGFVPHVSERSLGRLTEPHTTDLGGAERPSSTP